MSKGILFLHTVVSLGGWPWLHGPKSCLSVSILPSLTALAAVPALGKETAYHEKEGQSVNTAALASVPFIQGQKLNLSCRALYPSKTR